MPRELQYNIGIDEVGRGALAGPVLLVAFALPTRHPFRGIRDSKRLTPLARERWYRRFRGCPAVSWASGTSSAKTVDAINIRRAADRAARIAYLRLLGRHPELLRAPVLMDGGLSLGKGIPHRAFTGGDARYKAIACASIVAKVRRDRLMERLEARHAGYGFAAHKGYGTEAHRRALKRRGPSEAHRLTFLGKFLTV